MIYSLLKNKTKHNEQGNIIYLNFLLKQLNSRLYVINFLTKKKSEGKDHKANKWILLGSQMSLPDWLFQFLLLPVNVCDLRCTWKQIIFFFFLILYDALWNNHFNLPTLYYIELYLLSDILHVVAL